MICPICHKDLKAIHDKLGCLSLGEMITMHWHMHLHKSIREVLGIFDEAVEYYDDPRVVELRTVLDEKKWLH